MRTRTKQSACFHAKGDKAHMGEREILQKRFDAGNITTEELRRLAELNVKFNKPGYHFKEVKVSGELSFDLPKDDKTFVTIRVKGKNIQFSFEEHRILKLLGFIK